MSHGGGDSGRWLVSYADLITLMMALFLVLYTMGQVDIARYRALAGMTGFIERAGWFRPRNTR